MVAQQIVIVTITVKFGIDSFLELFFRLQNNIAFQECHKFSATLDFAKVQSEQDYFLGHFCGKFIT